MNTNKILIVDDDPMIRKLTWKSFQSTGILIYQADSIESALSICDRVTFDLFLLDIILDYENDGYFLAQTLRERFPMTPIIFLSGRTNESDIVTGLENGVDFLCSLLDNLHTFFATSMVNVTVFYRGH